VDFSDRVPVVLLHGLGSSSRDWTFQLPVLEARYRVLAIDLPGHGRTAPSRRPFSVHGMAEDVERRLENEALPAAHVIGVSLGACVGLALALRAPHRVRSLTIINGFAHLRPRGVTTALRMLVRLALLVAAPMPVVAWWVARITFPRPEHAALRRQAAESLTATSRRAYVTSVGALIAFDVRAQLGRVRCPVLVVAGDEDRTVPLASKRDLAAGITGARLCVAQGSGHASHYDAPETVNAALLEFLAAT
jgi:pimeloyl-ACP methyl ester carboxylesterase